MRRFNDYGYDAYIVGSDQVWRYNEGDPLWTWKEKLEPCFWLRFAAPGIKRISMAASFGPGTYRASDGMKEAFARELQEFSAISVREEFGRSFIRELSGREATLVVDPVFMLPPARWEKLMAAPRDKKGKRTVAYCSFLDAEDMVQTLTEAFPDHELVDLLGVSTEEWLREIHDADFVVSDSFHVSSFSVIFGVPFAVLIGKHRLAVERYRQLVTTYHLSPQLIIDTQETSSGLPAALRAVKALPADYTEAHRTMAGQAAAAKEWLEGALATPPPAGMQGTAQGSCALGGFREQLGSKRGRTALKYGAAKGVCSFLSRYSPSARGKFATLADRFQARLNSLIW